MSRSAPDRPDEGSGVGGAVDSSVDSAVGRIDQAMTELFRLSSSRRVHADRVLRSGWT